MNHAVSARRAAHAQTTALTGMTLFIASWAMLFTALFFAYALVRRRAPHWPPPDLPSLPLGWPALATLLLLASSLLMQDGLARTRAPRPGAAPRLGAAAALGSGFLGLQVLVWRDLALAGLTPTTGTYASVFYAMTGFHALHVVVGLCAIVFLTVRSAVRAYRPDAHIPVYLWTLYWHMVGIIWLCMFIALYVV